LNLNLSEEYFEDLYSSKSQRWLEKSLVRKLTVDIKNSMVLPMKYGFELMECYNYSIGMNKYNLTIFQNSYIKTGESYTLDNYILKAYESHFDKLNRETYNNVINKFKEEALNVSNEKFNGVIDIDIIDKFIEESLG